MKFDYSVNYLFRFIFDKAHGFGVQYANADSEKGRSEFYEDGTFILSADLDEEDSRTEGMINYLVRLSGKNRVRQYRRKKELSPEELLERGECTFSLTKGGVLQAKIAASNQRFDVRVEKGSNYNWYESVCSCGRPDCSHARTAGLFLEKRLEDLVHTYIRTDAPVDKSLFLEPSLSSAVIGLSEKKLDSEFIISLHHIRQMVREANSPAYYWLFHQFILDLDPRYYGYEAHYLEEKRKYLLFALFDDPGYRSCILEPGHYADSGDYEERQHRSNRASYKRVLKEYKKVVRELDVQGNYSENLFKELLLKCRGDSRGILHYFAVGKKELDPFDIPFLELILDLAESESVKPKPEMSDVSEDGTGEKPSEAGKTVLPEGLSPEDLQKVAGKLDDMDTDQKAMNVFSRCVRLLPADRKVVLISGLRNITISLNSLKEFPVEDQRKLINSIALSQENFHYVMDTLLADADASEKGKYLLRAAGRMRRSKDSSLKMSIARAATGLPDSRLLLAYLVYRLNLKGTWQARKGDPEKELANYFSCSYEIINEETRFYTSYEISDPEGGIVLLSAREEDDSLSAGRTGFETEDYTPELVRQVCLRGREEEYRREVEKNQEAVDAQLFEQQNRNFAFGYRNFCRSLSQEKLLVKETGKVGIEWQVTRNDRSNALSFRVGRNRMYVVRDAQEFIRSFKTGTTTEYGKDLILTHETDNLQEEDAAAVKILMTARFTKGRKTETNNKRYITVNDSLLANLFELLSGRTILYNEEPCLLRLESRSVRLKISGKYVLSTDLDMGKQEFLNLSGRGFLVTRTGDGKSLVIDQVNAGTDEIGLIDLTYQNPSTCIRPILADFRKNVYARFFEMFDVDKSVEHALSMGQIRLNTYFDFEKSVITSRTRAVRDGKEFPPEKLTERIDQMKYELLQDYLGALGFEDGTMADEAHILNFFKLDFTRLKSLTNVYLSESLQNKELRSVGKPVIRVTYNNNLVSVFLEKSDYNEKELEQILAGLRKKKKFILLSGDRIVDLSSETARDLGEAVKDFGMNPKDLHRQKTISMVAAIKAFSHERCCRVDKYLRDMIEEIRSFKESDIPLPGLQAELRDYQAEGFRWMSILAGYGMGGILADDMGLGKTIQIIALIKADQSKRPSLVVCPKSLVFNWISEYARFDASTKVIPIYGPDSRRTEIIESIRYREKAVYITSYDSLRNDIGKYSGQFQYGILDEAQYIKNVHALKTKSVKELKAKHRFALTGTPIENSIVDLWSIFDYIMPGYFEELSKFRDSDPADIARKSAPFILRRVKADVLEDLPPRYERILSADMTDGQRKVYEAMRQEARKQLEQGGKAFDILPYLTRLRQVCVDPAMFAEDYRSGSGKLDMLSELIPEYLREGHRILIFSQFVKALESVRKLLDGLDISCYFLSGATPARDRIDMMDSFNNGSGIDVFLISLKAGGTGLNLTGADTVIHLDPWWNVAAENQASDRTHRIGQTRNVEVIKLIAADSIEQRVVELQEIKKEVIRQVISDDDGSVTSARLEDIAFVLE